MGERGAVDVSAVASRRLAYERFPDAYSERRLRLRVTRVNWPAAMERVRLRYCIQAKWQNLQVSPVSQLTGLFSRAGFMQ